MCIISPIIGHAGVVECGNKKAKLKIWKHNWVWIVSVLVAIICKHWISKIWCEIWDFYSGRYLDVQVLEGLCWKGGAHAV